MLMRLLGSFKLFIFFYEKILHAPKAPKAQKHKDATKHKNANKQTKIKKWA